MSDVTLRPSPGDDRPPEAPASPSGIPGATPPAPSSAPSLGELLDAAGRSASPEVRAIEVALWERASPHEREAALLVGKATGQADMPHVLAALAAMGPADPVEGRLCALTLPLTNRAAEVLGRSRRADLAPGEPDRDGFLAVRMAEASAKVVDALTRYRSRGSTEHRITVTHRGRADGLEVGVRVRQGGEGHGGDGRGGAVGGDRHQSHAKALGHAPGPPLRRADSGREPVPVPAGEGQAEVPDARRASRGASRSRERQLAARAQHGRGAGDGADG